MFLYDFTKIKENLVESITISWKSIIALFIGMSIIYIVILILNKITMKKNK